jgi:glycosyltransferase involved in cell wall biosynthesis
MKPPLFSVLIPSRNRPELLRRAVASVLAQHADLEIVIGDNASEPPYAEYVESLGRVAAGSVCSSQALSVTESWNRTVQAARGEYLVMLGDDDALAPGWLNKAEELIRQFDRPDVLHAMAYHYAYPGVVRGHPLGYLATVNNSELFQAYPEPYLLPRERARFLGAQALRFRHRFSFNSQHFIWKRSFLDSMPRERPLFQGPYPDYHAAILTMLKADRIVVVPSAQVIIGISPKSFGYFYGNDQARQGQEMLGNKGPDAAWLAGQPDDVREAVGFPGSVHYRNWLISALLVQRSLGDAIEPEAVELHRYRRLQMVETLASYGDTDEARIEGIRALRRALHADELVLFEKLLWLRRVARRTPIAEPLLSSVRGMSSTYFRATVTMHDIGPHNSISDAFNWIRSRSEPPPPRDEPLIESSTPLAGEVSADLNPPEDELLPIQPLHVGDEGLTIAVVYLARSGDGSISDFEPFISSYRRHAAGIPHDLIILRKGLRDRAGAKAALAAMLEGIPHRAVDVSDEGFDIQAYLKISPHLRHERVCFLNTFSEINADGWLKHLSAPLDLPGVGMSGATGSYESLFTSLTFLSKVIWLTSAQNIQYSPEIAEQFREILKHHAPQWMAKRGSLRKRILRELARPFLGQRIDTPEIEAGFARHWAAVTKPDAALYPFRDVRPFPNPHLRSNAFMMKRALLLELGFQLDNTKAASNRFESGPEGLPTRLAERGLRSILVGADGSTYEVADWPKSRTFRLGDQGNVLVSDNQVRAFAKMDAWQKSLHVRMTWGEYVPPVRPEPRNFGIHFRKGDLRLADVRLPEDARSDPSADLLFSVVIPTRNRLVLLRDAIESVRRQQNSAWECVVFDNASEEPVREYVLSLGDPRIRCERSEEFLPVTDSWNHAIDLARGDYVTLLGDDDGLVPNYFVTLKALARKFGSPDVVYNALYQFFHPTVAPWQRSGYVLDLKNGFFFKGQEQPFVLSAAQARKAVEGSLGLRRNFTFNMQAFAFKREFVDRMRVRGKVFQSPFPDYYLANVAMGLAKQIVVCPKPLAIAGVSRASFGYTLFNNLEERGAALLKTDLSNDPLYLACESRLLPGPAYNTNYIVTMEHVVQALAHQSPGQVDFARYRRLQTLSTITGQDRLDWMRASPGSTLWVRLAYRERLWALRIGWLNWRAKSGSERAITTLDAIKAAVEPYGFDAIESNKEVGSFAVLTQLFDALESGAYPKSTQ